MTVRCWCSVPLLLLLLVSMVVVIADGGLGHCQFQTSSQTDECKNVKKIGKNAVRNKHTRYKVGETRFMRLSIGQLLTKLMKLEPNWEQLQPKYGKTIPIIATISKSVAQNQGVWAYKLHSHHGQQSTHTYTKNERGKQGTCTQCDIPLSTARRTRLGIMVVFSSKEGPKMSRWAVLSTSLPIIGIQWWVLIGSAFLAWHDSYSIHY